MGKVDGRTGRKPRPPREIGAESALARRIAYERQRRGLSYEALAIQMRRHGAPLDASALYRIEKGDPPRRITFDEAVGFSRTFGMSMDELQEDPRLVTARELRTLVAEVLDLHDKADEALNDLDESVRRLQAFAKAHPEEIEPFKNDPAFRGYLEAEVD